MTRKPVLLIAGLVGVACSVIVSPHPALAQTTSGNDSAAMGEPSAEKLFNEAWELYKDGPSQAEQIIQRLNAALELDPKHEEAAALLTAVYFGTEQFEDALKASTDALRTFHDKGKVNTTLYVLKARSLAALGQFNEARNLLISIDALVEGTGDEEYIDEVKNLREGLRQAQYKCIEPIASAAVARAVDLNVDASRFLILVVNKETSVEILEDPDVKPYIPEIAFEKNLWAAVFVSKDGSTEGRLTFLIAEDGTPYGTCQYGELPRVGDSESGPLALIPIDVFTEGASVRVMVYEVEKR